MILDSFRLDGKVALVTGANRGLGKGAAIALAEAGADVALLCRSSGADTAQAIRERGRRALELTCDLAQATPESLGRLVDDVVRELGRLDILINNAGAIARQSALEHSRANWDEILHIDLDAAFWLAQAAGGVFCAQGSGKIVTIASMLSFQGGINVISYATAKHGVAGFTQALANEWAGLGVNVNAIAPGYMATDNTAPLRADPARNEAINARIPAGRWGTSDDLAGAVVYLSSAASDYVHGTILAVDGGWLAR